MTPASFSFWQWTETPLPCGMLTVTSVPGLPLPWISLRANSSAPPTASASSTTSSTTRNLPCTALFCGGVYRCVPYAPSFFSVFQHQTHDSFRSRQRVLRQSGSCRIPAGCPRRGTAAGHAPTVMTAFSTMTSFSRAASIRISAARSLSAIISTKYRVSSLRK